ncbi:MAG: host-nuclease inhibitor Gam family protein [Candidatus Spyradocola sp.]|jgi:hypothetical protein
MSTMPMDDKAAGFVIDDDAKADWALEKIAEAEAERDRLHRVCQMRIDQFKAKMDEADRDCERERTYFLGLLSNYFDRVPHKATKTQETYALPSGKLVYRRPSMAAVKDDAALLAWARVSAPEYVETVSKAKWGELKKVLKVSGDRYIYPETGEVVDGARLEETPGRFEVSIR